MIPPPLPDTDDPWALLGVERDAPPEVVRRAYLAKIKVHKPDRAPEEFRRIREAYEAISAGGAMPSRRPPPSPSSATPDPPPAAEADEAPTETPAAPDRPSPYLARGDLEALLEARRTDEVFAALHSGRIDPHDVARVVHWLAHLLVLVDGAAFDRLAAAFPTEIRELASRDVAFALRLAGGAAITAWVAEGHAPCPALLALLVELPVADGARRTELVRALSSTVRGDPSGTLAAIDRIAAIGGEGMALVTEVLEDVVQGMPDRVFDARMLSVNATGFGYRIDSERGADRRLHYEGAATGVVALGVAGVLVKLGVPGIGAIIGVALAWVVLYVVYDASRSFYHRKLRALLIEHASAHPVPSARVVDALREAAGMRSSDRDAFASDDFGKYVTLVAEDLGLHAFVDLTWIAWASVTLDAEDEPAGPG